MKKKLSFFLITFVSAVALSILSFYLFFFLPTVEHVNASKEELEKNDFSAQAQVYLEYFGNNLKHRSGLFSQHHKTQKFIINELKEAGYKDDQITILPIEGRSGKNIELKVEGEDTSKCIIIGAHFDGDGIGDNASGTALLLANACGLYGTKLPVTTYFMFFDEEESGMIGSEYYAECLTDEEANSVLYMVNIDAIAFGDYCNIYGGVKNPKTKEITKTEGYYHACSLAKQLDFHVYTPDKLSGYYEKHGKGPELDSLGIFTNPWTKENPAPENTVSEELRVYSPATLPASDHVAFSDRGIIYIYFEATNWYVKTDYEDAAYLGYTDVGDETVGDKGFIMNTRYDTLKILNREYPGRSLEHFKLYSPLLSALVLQPNIED